MDNTPLVRAIVDALAFVDDAGDDEIEPDTAVKCTEVIGAALDGLTGADRAEFALVLERIATSADDPAYAEYVRSVPFLLWGPPEE
ncbi:hypothetical protein [Saccharothrix carnea]|uniref:hypothetical protein n=1 Tax=Saccharothrix carnea TaxID=1280637 RepID=UPI000D0D1E36|nr:hypothetical protein [Saccharothrix carnea]